jgi:hypothetical protein
MTDYFPSARRRVVVKTNELLPEINNSSFLNSPGSITLNIKTKLNSVLEEGVNVQFYTCPRMKS